MSMPSKVPDVNGFLDFSAFSLKNEHNVSPLSSSYEAAPGIKPGEILPVQGTGHPRKFSIDRPCDFPRRSFVGPQLHGSGMNLFGVLIIYTEKYSNGFYIILERFRVVDGS